MNRDVFSPSILLRILTLFPNWSSIRLFCDVLFVLIIAPRLFCFIIIRLLFCLCGFTMYILIAFYLLFSNIPSSLYCFILSWYLFNLSSFVSTFWFIFSSCIFCFTSVASFHSDRFQLSSFVLSFSLVVADFLFAFPVELPIHVLSFCSCSLREQRCFYKLI